MRSLMLDNVFKDFDGFFQQQGSECSVISKKEGISLYFDMPGVKKEDIKLTLDARILRIEFERKDHKSGKEKRLYRLNNDVDLDNIQSHLEDGVLKIDLPLLKRENSRVISIK